jgi:hypothetical protein
MAAAPPSRASALASIEVLGLDRDGLVRGRRRVALRLAVIRKNMKRTAELLEDYPGDQRLVDQLFEDRRELDRMTQADKSMRRWHGRSSTAS